MAPSKFKIADLHCDLLDALVAHPGVTALDPQSGCSIPQLRQGNVGLQVMAMFAESMEKPAQTTLAQARLFAALLQQYPQDLSRLGRADELNRASTPTQPIKVIAAIENASGFCSDSEPLADGLRRLDEIIQIAGPILYCTITWHGESRFGGGNSTTVGLKEDGKRLVEVLVERNIAIDFSHTSDALAADLLQFMDKEKLSGSVLASHSNFRQVKDVPRNLPDELVQEIVRHNGIIGMNWMTEFIGETAEAFLQHWAYAAKNNILSHYAFGADFFLPDELDRQYLKKIGRDLYFKDYSDASGYPRLLQWLQKDGGATVRQLEDLAWNNAVNYIQRVLK